MYKRYDRHNKSLAWKILDSLSGFFIFTGFIILTILLLAI